MKYVFGNWKMYLDFDESNILINGLLQEKFDSEKVGLAVFPSTLALREVTMSAKDTEFAVGAQNVAWVPKGAYTGAVSAQMFSDVGCHYALVGHSERRHVFGETNDDVRKKIEACLETNLIPVVCIGETEDDLEAGKREYRLKKQLMKAFENLELNGGKVVVAYEPVWAIGTGKACDPATAQEVHAFLKTELKQYFDADITVLYGGSVKAENVVSYVALGAIDGVLVGGASARLDSFTELIRAVEGV
ncbi:MAG: triose-phosphate isomerase [Candidatus Magasanikbacteria bacterium]|jgi:triosephosphate isomerase (TIM)|nr:triose-phosphate isomerase [Candidatus Magasanikbacteria bacterium]MBT4314495.1 triose-phosphate isomerase [Candidatus Magasanikbacteria bacterium]MBT4547299.1 triose-phosphate isomerase [Candidatus Magasanikbacteria bacterium]MBT6818932.1 triose-phosphate isomerase [Candidatus Magasanikbacteria bacterium]